jgi:hypothetical protein
MLLLLLLLLLLHHIGLMIEARTHTCMRIASRIAHRA